MRPSNRSYLSRTLPERFSNDLILLVAICLILFIALAFLKAVWYFNYEDKDLARALFARNVLGQFALPADPGALLARPWSLLSFPFLHDGNEFWSVFSNMFWLASFGMILRSLTGGRMIIPVYLYGALGGGIAFLIAHQLLPGPTGFMLGGATCGVMAIAIVTTLFAPNYRLFPNIGKGIPLWVISSFYLVSLFTTVSVREPGLLATHLTALLVGALFLWCYRLGYDGSAWMNRFFDWLTHLFHPDRPRKGQSAREYDFYQTGPRPFVRTPRVSQERIDAILEKIHQQGYDQLTGEERELLDRASRGDS